MSNYSPLSVASTVEGGLSASPSDEFLQFTSTTLFTTDTCGKMENTHSQLISLNTQKWYSIFLSMKLYDLKHVHALYEHRLNTVRVCTLGSMELEQYKWNLLHS